MPATPLAGLDIGLSARRFSLPIGEFEIAMIASAILHGLVSIDDFLAAVTRLFQPFLDHHGTDLA